jgi:adenine-specific DNA-methyltransferase
MIQTANYVVDTLSQRRGGIYYTPSLAAEILAAWAIRSDGIRVMEPCFGAGVFLAAIKQVSSIRNFTSVHTNGVELMGLAHRTAIEHGIIETDDAILGDFLGVRPFPVDSVIGNPPYIRLRSLPEDQRERALAVTRETLGTPMDTSGSVWMAFVLHATRFIKNGGRMALVLPYEFTHVRYALPLWKYLGENFGNLCVVRVKERLFPDILQEAIILFADHRGGNSSNLTFEAYQTTEDFANFVPLIRKSILINDIIKGGRPFIKALLSVELTDLLDNRLKRLTAPLSDFCDFNIGYVSGNKEYFHPDTETISKFGLRESSLRDTLTSSRELRGIGIRTSSISSRKKSKLFVPNGSLSSTEIQYIEEGERIEVNRGYKCGRRIPWYKVPDVRVPDFMLSVFKETPTLVLNDGLLVASNSLLCGFLHSDCSSEEFIAAWYTSLTLLYCELRVHSLGGGVLVFIPGEVSTIRIPKSLSLPTMHLTQIDRVLKTGAGNPYRLGDEPLLKVVLKLTEHEIRLIEEGVCLLAAWRKTARNTAS